MPPSDTDRIERSIVIQAPRARVWQALSDAETFGRWFGCDLRGQRFVAGQRTQGPISIEGYGHLKFDVVVESIEPERSITWRWHPYPMDPAVDYDAEEPTRVIFTLQDAPGGGTLLTVVEEGFDRVPPGRRPEAFRMNSRGWEIQLENLRAHATAQ
jgi:uncharacterized protein YndB with AHSA1/START domain